MKRNIFLITLLFLTGISFISPHKSFAVDPGTFSCRWTGGFCTLDTAKSNCAAGYSDLGACGDPIQMIPCIAIKNQTCIAGTAKYSSEPGLWCGKQGILKTAIGCIPIFDQTNFLSTLLIWAVGIGGGIAFLLIIYAGFMVMTAAGNPERLKAGQELLTSAISGLILLVFSIFILKFIGIDILGLGAFGFGATSP